MVSKYGQCCKDPGLCKTTIFVGQRVPTTVQCIYLGTCNIVVMETVFILSEGKRKEEKVND